jgi:hypothetical protein
MFAKRTELITNDDFVAVYQLPAGPVSDKDQDSAQQHH